MDYGGARRQTVRVVVYCEGESEMWMVRNMLIPFLRKFGWQDRLTPRNFENSGQFLRKIGEAVKNALRVDSADHVFGLIDLHGTHIAFPRSHHTPSDKADYLKADLKTRVHADYRDRFHPHVAVHELEAWLLADERVLSDRLGLSVTPWANPEGVNFDKPPARHLDELFQRHLKKAYGKVKDGSKLFSKIDPEIVLRKCPHFKLLVDDLISVTT